MAREASLFKLPGYPAWFVADTALLAGSAVHWVALPLVAYELSGSIVWAGWFATARAIVSSITQAVGGVYIDRHDHRRLILVQSGICAILWFLMGLLFVLDKLTFSLFFGLCLTASAVFGFLGGTTNAALITVVGPKRYARAESINQGRDAAVNTAGSPLGAALYGFAHAGPFFASAFFDVISFLAGLRLQLPHRDHANENEAGGLSTFFSEFLDGWRWVIKSRTVVSIIITMALVSFAIFGINQAVSLYLVSIGTDALLISLVNLLSGAATMVGSVVSARIVDNMAVGKAAPIILVFMICGLLPMILAPGYATILASMVLVGLPMPILQALSLGFVFSKTPVDLQGRTRAAIMTSTMLFTSGTGGVAGTLLPAWGLTPVALLFASLLAVGVMAVVLSPRLRAIPAPTHWESVEL